MNGHVFKIGSTATDFGGDFEGDIRWVRIYQGIISGKELPALAVGKHPHLKQPFFEWNSAAATTTGGQSFSNKIPTVITDATKVTGGTPKTSVGAVGDYAIVATTTLNKFFYKNASGTWVQVGSSAWIGSWATVTGTESNPTITGSATMSLNSTVVTAGGTALSDVVTAIAGAGIIISIIGTMLVKINNNDAKEDQVMGALNIGNWTSIVLVAISCYALCMYMLCAILVLSSQKIYLINLKTTLKHYFFLFEIVRGVGKLKLKIMYKFHRYVFGTL